MSEQKETRCQFCNALLLSEKSANAKCANGESLVDFLGMEEVKGAMPRKLWDDKVKKEYVICKDCFDLFTPLLYNFCHVCMKATLDAGQELKGLLKSNTDPKIPSWAITKIILPTLVHEMYRAAGKACYEIGKSKSILMTVVKNPPLQEPAQKEA